MPLPLYTLCKITEVKIEALKLSRDTSTYIYAYCILNILPKEINLYLFFKKIRWVIAKSSCIFLVILYTLLRSKRVVIKMLPSFSVCYFKKNMFYVILTFGKFTKPGT